MICRLNSKMLATLFISLVICTSIATSNAMAVSMTNSGNVSFKKSVKNPLRSMALPISISHQVLAKFYVPNIYNAIIPETNRENFRGARAKDIKLKAAESEHLFESTSRTEYSANSTADVYSNKSKNRVSAIIDKYTIDKPIKAISAN